MRGPAAEILQHLHISGYPQDLPVIRVLDRIELDRSLDRVAGDRPAVGGPGFLFEIRDRALHPLPLPHPDSVPVAIDAQGRLIAGRISGDRVVRRYRGRLLDGTFPIALDEILALAVSGDLGMSEIRDVIPGADAWALGDALVCFEV